MTIIRRKKGAMKSVILPFLVLGVCIIVATAYPAYPINYNRQYMPYDHIRCKFHGHSISIIHHRYVDFISILAQNRLNRHNLPYFQNGAWERELTILIMYMIVQYYA